MKKLIVSTLILVGTVNSAFASGGAGVRGGGEVANVVIDGKVRKELYDLVSQYTCNWKTGKAMVEENPELLKILGKLSKMDWYLAMNIRKEIEWLEFCVTGNLLPSLRKAYPSPTDSMLRQRAAVRLGDDVWWDADLAQALPQKSRAWLLVHEAMHRWMNSHTTLERYYQNLWSTINLFEKVNSGILTNLNEFYFQLEKNQVTFPHGVLEIGSEVRGVLEFLNAADGDQKNAVLKADQPEELVAVKLPLSPATRFSLLEQDVQILKNLNYRENQLAEVIKNILSEGTTAQFQMMLKKKYARISPVSLALMVYSKLSSEKRKLLGLSMDQAFAIVVNELNSARVFEITSEEVTSIGANEAMQKLGSQKNLVAPYYLRQISPFSLKTDIASFSPGVGGGAIAELEESTALVSAELLTLVHLTIHMIKTGDSKKIAELVRNNEAFHNIFNAEKWIKKIEVMTPTVAREKQLGLRLAKQIAERAYGKYLELIEERVSADQYKWFIQQLN